MSKQGTVVVEDHTIQYIITGKGEHAVLLLPGALGTSLTDFAPQLEGFDQNLFTMVGWDPPGYGVSRPPQHLEHFPTDFYQRDAKLAVKTMQALGFKTFSLMGWSNGGTTAMLAAIAYPELIRKLVIWGTRSYIAKEDIEKIEQVKDVEKWSERMKKSMEEVHGKEFPTLWASFCKAYIAIYESGGDICSNSLKNIAAPTLVMFGEKDALVAAEHINHLHKNIEGSQKLVFPEGKHNLHLKYKKEFNDVVQNFLNK